MGRDLARRLVMEYNNLKESARKKAENWFDLSDATQKKAFLDIQNGLSLKDLTTSMLSSAHMAQIIEKASSSALILKKKDDASRIDDMFARLKIQADQLSLKEQENMREAAELYITAGVITQEFIQLALKSLDTSASDYESNVQALVQEFLPMTSVYEMRQYGVLSYERLEAMALESYRASLQRIRDRLGTTPTEPAYNPGSSDEVLRNTPEFQDFYMNFISSENGAFHYQFPTEWLKFEEIEKLFLQNDQAMNRFARLIESKIDTENQRRFETFDAMKHELTSGNFLTDEEKNKIRG